MLESTRCQEGAARAEAAQAATRVRAARMSVGWNVQRQTGLAILDGFPPRPRRAPWAMSRASRPMSASHIRHFKAREVVEGAPVPGEPRGGPALGPNRARLTLAFLSTAFVRCGKLHTRAGPLCDPTGPSAPVSPGHMLRAESRLRSALAAADWTLHPAPCELGRRRERTGKGTGQRTELPHIIKGASAHQAPAVSPPAHSLSPSQPYGRPFPVVLAWEGLAGHAFPKRLQTTAEPDARCPSTGTCAPRRTAPFPASSNNSAPQFLVSPIRRHASSGAQSVGAEPGEERPAPPARSPALAGKALRRVASASGVRIPVVGATGHSPGISVPHDGALDEAGGVPGVGPVAVPGAGAGPPRPLPLDPAHVAPSPGRAGVATARDGCACLCLRARWRAFFAWSWPCGKPPCLVEAHRIATMGPHSRRRLRNPVINPPARLTPA